MIAVVAAAVFLLAAAGVYLLWERTLFRLVLGLGLLGHAANLVVLSAGGWRPQPPILGTGADAAAIADPLPQALVLTAIVISMAVTLYLAALVAVSGGRGATGIAPAPADDEGRDPREVAAELSGRPADGGPGR